MFKALKDLLLYSKYFITFEPNNKLSVKNTKDTHKITRKEALKKMGKYAAFTAIGTFLILNPKTAQAQSIPPDPGGDPFD